MFKYQSTFTSGGKATSTANQVITFVNPKYSTDNEDYNNKSDYNCVVYLSFETFATECRIKLNDETTIHWIDANSKVEFSDIMITKITILDAGVQYYYTGLSTK